MANDIAKRDDNRIPNLMAVTNDSSQELRNLKIDPATGGLLVKILGGGGDNIYNTNGTLTGARTVDQDGNKLLFTVNALGGAGVSDIEQSDRGNKLISTSTDTLKSSVFTTNLSGGNALFNILAQDKTTPGTFVGSGLTGSSLGNTSLRGSNSLNILTPAVHASTATVGQVLTLQDATTGEVEYADVTGGGVSTADNGLYLDGTTVKLGTNPLIEETIVDIDGNSMIFQGQAPGLPTGDDTQFGAFEDAFDGPGIPATGAMTLRNIGSDSFIQFLLQGDMTNVGATEVDTFIGFVDPSGTIPRQSLMNFGYEDDNMRNSGRWNVSVGGDDVQSYIVADSNEVGYVLIDDLAHISNRIRIRDDRAEVNYDFDDGTDIYVGQMSARKENTTITSGHDDGTTNFNAQVILDNANQRIRNYLDDDTDTTTLDTELGLHKLDFSGVEQFRANDYGFVLNNTLQEKKGDDIPATSNLVIPAQTDTTESGNAFYVSGTGATIDFMTISGYREGTTITLWIPSGNTIVNGSTATPVSGSGKFSLAGATNLTTTTSTILNLRLWTGSWVQMTPILEL